MRKKKVDKVHKGLLVDDVYSEAESYVTLFTMISFDLYLET